MAADFHNLPVVTTDQMSEVDRLMIEEWGITLFQMMENAGRNFAELARRQLGGTVQGKRIAVLCGQGNNGGGGMTAARHLHNWGAQVEVILAGDENGLKLSAIYILQVLACPPNYTRHQHSDCK